jgi:hypothetical protein
MTPLNITLIMAALFLARPLIDWWNRSRMKTVPSS